MQIRTWRFILTVGAVALLAAMSIGLVAASVAPPPVTHTVVAAPSTLPDRSTGPNAAEPDRPIALERLERGRWGLGLGRLLHAARHLVHAEVTVTDADGKLIVLTFDHGTVKSIGGGTLVIAEQGGGTESVSVDDATIVHVGRADGSLDDITAGDEVFVQSRVDGGTTLAKRILILPARAAS